MVKQIEGYLMRAKSFFEEWTEPVNNGIKASHYQIYIPELEKF